PKRKHVFVSSLNRFRYRSFRNMIRILSLISQQRRQRFLPDIIRPERLPTGFCIITKPMPSLIRNMSLHDLTAIHRDLFSLQNINTAMPFFQQTRKPVARQESIKPSLKGRWLNVKVPFAYRSGAKP